MRLISFRRHYLDLNLKKSLPHMAGNTLDIGGVKINKRGYFKVPSELIPNWKYLNINPATGADIIASVPPIPVANDTYDTVVLAEVLEYIFPFENLVFEINRVLKQNGKFILSVPFIHPLHGDFQSDYFRFTESGILKIIEDKFEVETLERMGGPIAIIADIILNISKARNTILDKLIVKCINLLHPLILLFDNPHMSANTGFFIVARKR